MANKFATKKNEGVTASSLFALDSKTGHSKIYDELCDIVDRVSYSGVLNAEDATDEYPDSVAVEFEVTSEDSAPYSVMVYIYSKEENDEESQLSYSVHDEYTNNLKGYIPAAQGSPLGPQKDYKISELSQMWNDIEKDIQTLVSSADTDESKQKESKKNICSMQKKIESFKKNEDVDDDVEQMLADIQGVVNKYFRGGKNITIRLNCTPTQDWVELDNKGYTDRVPVGGTANAFIARDVINKIINKYYL